MTILKPLKERLAKLEALAQKDPTNTALTNFIGLWNNIEAPPFPSITYSGYSLRPFFRLVKLPPVSFKEGEKLDPKQIAIRDFHKFMVVSFSEAKREQMQLYPGFERTLIIWGRRPATSYNIAIQVPTDDNPEYDLYQQFIDMYDNELRGAKPFKEGWRFGVVIGKRYIEGALVSFQSSLNTSNVASIGVDILSDYSMQFDFLHMPEPTQ